MRAMVLILLLTLPVRAATLTVAASGGADYADLDAAVAAASAGDTVSVVEAGSYTLTEKINGKDGLTIRNDSGGVVNVTRDGAGSYVLQVTTALNGLTLRGLTFDMNLVAEQVLQSTAVVTGFLMDNCTIREVADEGLDCTAPLTGTIQDSTFISAGSTKPFVSLSKGGTLAVTRCTLIGDGTAGGIPFYFDTGSGGTTNLDVTFSRCLFRGYNHTYLMYFRNDGGDALTADLTLTSCLVLPYEDGAAPVAAGGIYARDYNTHITCTNCSWEGLSAWAFVLANDTGGGATDLTVDLTNCSFIGMGMSEGGRPVASASNSPVINMTNCYLNYYPLASVTEIVATTNVNPIRSETDLDVMDPKFATYPTEHGYILLTGDDIEDNAAYWVDVLDITQPKGVEFTLFINPSGNGLVGIDLSADADWLALVAHAGWVPGVHSWSHSGLQKTEVCTIKMKTADTATMTKNATTFSIDCSNDAGDITLDITSAAYDAGYEVYSALAAAPYSTYYTLGAFFDGTGTRSTARSWAAMTAQAIPAAAEAAYSILLGTTAPNWEYFEDEIKLCKAWIVANTTATAADIITMAAPGSKTPEAFVTYLKATVSDPDAGIVFNRGLAVDGYTINGSATNLRQINMLVNGLCSTARAFGPSTGGTRTQAEVVSYATRLAVWCKVTGRSCAVYSHGYSDEGANLITPQEWGWFIDAVQSVDPDMLKSPNQFVDLVHDSGTWTQDGTNGEVWNATFTDAGDRRLAAGSCLINAGTVPAGFETAYPLDPDVTTLSPWSPVAATRDYGAREIGPFAYPQGAPGGVGGWGWLGRRR